MRRMAARVTIGQFSVMTRLSKKALRHYHELGLLEPALTDPETGYRHYDTSQVQQAQVIRRFRELGMSVPDVKAVLVAGDVGARSEIIATHLQQMEDQLVQTQQSVAALRELLAPTPIEVELRGTRVQTVAAITQTVPLDGITEWFSAALLEIRTAIEAAGVTALGTPGGYYADELFTEELGEATVFIPVRAGMAAAGRVRTLELPAGEWAVTTHVGHHGGIDRTYGALGTYVSERLLAIDGPVRENYLGDNQDGQAVTEICWPIFRTSSPLTSRSAKR